MRLIPENLSDGIIGILYAQYHFITRSIRAQPGISHHACDEHVLVTELMVRGDGNKLPNANLNALISKSWSDRQRCSIVDRKKRGERREGGPAAWRERERERERDREKEKEGGRERVRVSEREKACL